MSVAENLGFHNGRPLAAVVIFRSCLQWRVFQADRTTLFDRIINTMGAQIERQQEDNGALAYWLSNTVTLLYMLQRNIKPASGGAYSSRIRSPATRSVGRSGSHSFCHPHRSGLGWRTVLTGKGPWVDCLCSMCRQCWHCSAVHPAASFPHSHLTHLKPSAVPPFKFFPNASRCARHQYHDHGEMIAW